MSSSDELALLVDCACFNVRVAARAVTGFYDRALEPSGLKLTQLLVLGAVRSAGAVSMQGLAQLLGLDPSTLSRTLQPLESENLIRLEETEQDRRVRQVVLTAAGHRRYTEALQGWREAQTKLRDKLGERRLARLVDDLRALVRAAAES